MAGTQDGDMGVPPLEGPSPAVPAEVTSPQRSFCVLQPAGQLKAHGVSWVEGDAGDARRCHLTAVGDVALPKTGPWAGPEPCCAPRTPREKERTTLVGDINLLQPRTDGQARE